MKRLRYGYDSPETLRACAKFTQAARDCPGQVRIIRESRPWRRRTRLRLTPLGWAVVALLGLGLFVLAAAAIAAGNDAAMAEIAAENEVPTW